MGRANGMRVGHDGHQDQRGILLPSLLRSANDNGPLSADRPSASQRRWLRRGLVQPGGKLPLFDDQGRHVSERTIRSCIDRGWAEPWFDNPIKPGWLVCRLTPSGRDAVRS